MKIIGVIPARYKSSRFPGKPLVDILGKPMLWWVYQQCLKVPEFSEIYVATDDTRIEEMCKKYNMQVIMTSDQHKTGSDRVGEVATKLDGDLFVNIQGDEPVIEPQMIQQLIGIFEEEAVYFGSLRKEITDQKEITSFSTVKVVVDKNDDALYFSRSVIPSNIKDGNLAKVFRHVGIYAYKKDFLLKFVNMDQTELELGEGVEPLRAIENGYKIRVRETKFESIGVDLPEHVADVEKKLINRDECKYSHKVAKR
ncbi:MAG: 3-deoxy-manno-octulosonate cytidylyltransferase [Bacillota bacterium]|nr:3-deoxy-manno-octulosonate cytidylyltransferase [Bacillota bacterium]